MKKTFIVGLPLALGLALVTTFALAWGPGFGPGFGRGFRGPPNWVSPGLGFGPWFARGSRGSVYGVPPIPDLTAGQSARIQALRDGFLKEIEPLQKDFYTKRTELRTLRSAPDSDGATATTKQKEILDVQSKLQEKATTLGLEIRKVLTPEQLAELPAFSLGAGFGPSGCGPPIGMRGPYGRW